MISRNIHTKPICTISDMYKGIICRTCIWQSEGAIVV